MIKNIYHNFDLNQKHSENTIMKSVSIRHEI